MLSDHRYVKSQRVAVCFWSPWYQVESLMAVTQCCLSDPRGRRRSSFFFLELTLSPSLHSRPWEIKNDCFSILKSPSGNDHLFRRGGTPRLLMPFTDLMISAETRGPSSLCHPWQREGVEERWGGGAGPGLSHCYYSRGPKGGKWGRSGAWACVTHSGEAVWESSSSCCTPALWAQAVSLLATWKPRIWQACEKWRWPPLFFFKWVTKLTI